MKIAGSIRLETEERITADTKFSTLDLHGEEGTLFIWFDSKEARAALLKAAQTLATIDDPTAS